MPPNSTLPQRIDVHSHFLPKFYATALQKNGHAYPDGMPGIPPWDSASHLAMMVENNISKSIISVSSPGVHLVPGDDVLARDLASAMNSHAAELKKSYPDKFGFWASLPLPNIDFALAEIDHAIALTADGFGLLTNYHGHYIGSEKFDPVFEKLNRVGATVFIHPTKPCTHQIGMDTTIEAVPLAGQYRIPMFEFFFDTTRAVINLFLSRTVEKYPNITYVLPHAGGCMPPLWTRFVEYAHLVPGGNAIDQELARKSLAERFYFDLAGWPFDGVKGGRGQLKALVEGYGISHERLLYGSDYPFTKAEYVKQLADRMKLGLENLFEEEGRQAIYEGNAKKLLEKKMQKVEL